MKLELSIQGIVNFIKEFYPNFLSVAKMAKENRERIDTIEGHILRKDNTQYLPSLSFLERHQDQVKLFNESEKGSFGIHLTIDGYLADEKKLNDKKLLNSMLDELPEKINMKKLAKPVIEKAEPNDKKDCGGYSGYVLIAESHISCHTFPKKGFVSIDVYTCSDELNVEFVENYFKEKYQIKIIEKNVFKRGLRFNELCNE